MLTFIIIVAVFIILIKLSNNKDKVRETNRPLGINQKYLNIITVLMQDYNRAVILKANEYELELLAKNVRSETRKLYIRRGYIVVNFKVTDREVFVKEWEFPIGTSNDIIISKLVSDLGIRTDIGLEDSLNTMIQNAVIKAITNAPSEELQGMFVVAELNNMRDTAMKHASEVSKQFNIPIETVNDLIHKCFKNAYKTYLEL